MLDDQNQKDRFENDRTGYRMVVPMSGGTGERGDIVVVDDPHTVEQAESDAARTSANEWWNGMMSTRLNDLSHGKKVVIQQRLHEADLTGDLLARGGYEHLCLPAEFEPDRRSQTSIGWKDPRTVLGELLWPERINSDTLEGIKKTLGSYRYARHYQQRPAPASGGMIQRHWFATGSHAGPICRHSPCGCRTAPWNSAKRSFCRITSTSRSSHGTWRSRTQRIPTLSWVRSVQHSEPIDSFDQVRARMDFPKP